MAAMRTLIVGGGIAGLAAARALRLRGRGAEIVERAPEWRIAGAGVYVPGNGVAALRELGLADAVIAQGAVVGRRRLLDDGGRAFIDYDEAGLWRGVAPPIALHRADLHEILLEGASGLPIRMATTVTSVEAAAYGVRVTFDDGTAGDYDLVIGADGVHSTTRQQVFGGPPATSAGQVGWRFVLDGHPEIEGWNGWLSRSRGFLALAIGAGRIYCYADVRSRDAGDPTGGDPARLAALFRSFASPVPDLLDELSGPAELWFSPVEEVRPTWRRDRVVLIGDAAHASSPNMAEGASLAIEDALVLAQVLSEAASPADVPAALGTFEDRRAERVAWVQRTTHRRDRLRYAPPLVRRVTMRVAGRRIFDSHYRPLLAPP